MVKLHYILWRKCFLVPPPTSLTAALDRREKEGQHGRHKGTKPASTDIVNEVKRPKSELMTEAKSS